jgi:hypothetical protein
MIRENMSSGLNKPFDNRFYMQKMASSTEDSDLKKTNV